MSCSVRAVLLFLLVTLSRGAGAFCLGECIIRPGWLMIYHACALGRCCKRFKDRRNLPSPTTGRAGIVKHNYEPKGWRTARLVFLPKPGNDTYETAKFFSPISLTSFLLKTLERLVERHITETSLSLKPLHTNQHAYMAGRSVETALHSLTRRVEGALK